MSGMIGCELLTDDPGPGITDPNASFYSARIQPIFEKRCNSCHGGLNPREGLNMETWDSLLVGSDHGGAMIPFSSESSTMIRLATQKLRTSHPDGRYELTQDEINDLKRWIDDGARGPRDQLPFAESKDLIYVAHEAEPFISVIDPELMVVTREIDLFKLGFSLRARARHFAVEPDGSYWYASIGSVLFAEAHWVVKFSRDNRVVSKIQMQNAGQLLLHPTKDLLYASRLPNTGDTSRNLIEIRRSDMQFGSVNVLHKEAYAVALWPQGDFVFSASMEADRLVAVQVPHQRVCLSNINGIKHVIAYLAMAPGSSKMWGSGRFSGTLTKFDISNPCSIVTNHSLWVGADPRQLTYSPDGQRLYAAVRNSNRLVVLNAQEEVIEKTIQHEAMQMPVGVSVTRDGKYLYVSSENELQVYRSRFSFEGVLETGTVTVFDTESMEVVKVIETRGGAAAMGSSVVVPLTTSG